MCVYMALHGATWFYVVSYGLISLILALSGCSGRLLVVPGWFWLLLAAPGLDGYWMLLNAFGWFWLLLDGAILSNVVVCGPVSYFRLLLAPSGILDALCP